MWPFRTQELPQVANTMQINDYETITKRVVDLSARISVLELNEEAFRNKVLRKMQKPREDTEDINTSRPGIIGYGNNSKQ